MRAVQMDRTGPPEVLRIVELPTPTPGPEEVRVDVAIAAITFVETQVRAGSGPQSIELPAVLGNGVVGVVAELGEDVDSGWEGARVVTSTGGAGGYAEQAIARAEDLHRVPPELDDATAAALVADGRTALALTRAAAISAGDWVLVTAAAGGVGSLLVQLAVARGAYVVGLAGSERKLTAAQELGADVVVSYRHEGWAELVRGRTGGVDVAFDGVGGEPGRAVYDLVGIGGRYLPHGMAAGPFVDVDPADVERRRLQVLPLGKALRGPDDNYALVELALAEAAGGRLRPLVGQTYPLEETAAAHRAIEARETLGKTLLTI